MIHFTVPGDREYAIHSLVVDFNGTIATDGKLISGFAERARALHDQGVSLYVVTADTHGNVAKECAELPVAVHVTRPVQAEWDKENLIRRLGKDGCVAIGNGRNDVAMLKESALGICIAGAEGAYGPALCVSDVVVTNILDALD